MRSRLFYLLPLLLLPSLAAAFSSTSSANQTTYSGFTATPSNVGGYTLSTATNGTVLVRSPVRLSVGGGGSIPIDVTGSVAKPTVIGAIGRFLAKGSGVVGILAVGVGVYDLAKELNFILGNDGDTVTVIAPPHPSTAQNLDYRHSASNDWSKSIVPACVARAASLNNSVQSVTYDTWTPQANCRLRRTSIPGGAVDFIFSAVETRTQVGPDPGAGPATIAELEQAINEQQSWTVTSALNRALLDAVKSGEQVAVGSPVTSGPASAPVSTTTTVDPQTGNTTTTVVTINNTYTGPNVTTTTTTTTSVKNTSTNAPVGSPVTSTVSGPVSSAPVSPSTTSPSTEPAPFAMPCGVAGTPPCGVKVDESETPAEVSEEEFKPMLDKPKQEQAELLDKAKGDADKAFFDGFADLFVTPALATCVPLEIPGDRGIIDPCGTVDGARAIMAYIWALSGLALCLHMVRKAL